jgi:DNA-binding MarR family transcriptional regulator
MQEFLKDGLRFHKQMSEIFKKPWTPEANRYSRAIRPAILLEIIESLNKGEINLLFYCITYMNSKNELAVKLISKMKMDKMTKARAKKSLIEKGYIWIDSRTNQVLVNPSVALLTKHRTECLEMIKEWNNINRDTLVEE